MSGLSSMPVQAKYNSNLKIVRPFLSLEKKDLKYVTLNYFKTYIKDPSNRNKKYLRVRIRQYRKNLEKEGLDFGFAEYNEIDNYCKSKGIEWFASAWDIESQKFLRQFNTKYNK